MSDVTNFSNVAVDTTLNGAITDSATTLDVVSDTGYPAVPFNIQIEDEVIRVTARTTTDFSVIVRGYDGTTAAAHSDSTDVVHVVIAEDIGGTIKTWSPTYTNLTIGNGIVVARYQAVGKVVWFYWSLDFGSTSAMASGPTMSLPITSNMPTNDINSQKNVIGNAVLHDATGGGNVPGIVALFSTTQMRPRYFNSAGPNVLTFNLTVGGPFTWTTDDRLILSGSYESI